jgi:hypothetical protein
MLRRYRGRDRKGSDRHLSITLTWAVMFTCTATGNGHGHGSGHVNAHGHVNGLMADFRAAANA